LEIIAVLISRKNLLVVKKGLVINMRKIPCLSLAERMNGIYQNGDFFSATQQLIKESGYSAFHRLYIGSSFCDQYLLTMTKEMIADIRQLCDKLQLKLTLVLPLVTQKNLLLVKEQIQEVVLIIRDCLDEITVNDFGMLVYIHKNYKQNINLGRLFMKDYRDKRYEEYFKTTLRPKIINQVMIGYMKQYKVSGIEFDLTHQVIDLIQVPKDLTIGFHYPYCYQTVGHICEVGSINVETAYKFRPSQPCHQECEEQLLVYDTKEGGRYYKRGRAVYFENSDCEISNCDEIRLIYTPKFRGGELM
jgi:hypothetical protein